EPVAGVSIVPLLPNWFRTNSTPPTGGIRGTVYRGERGLAREFENIDLSGNIVMLPTGSPWTTVAAMGAAAVLYVDDPAQPAKQNWSHTLEASIDVPRFFVQGTQAAIEALVGQEITLHAGQDFEN